MSRKALKALVEVKFTAVSCPGVHLPTKEDVNLSMCFMGQYRQSESLPAVFPLLFHEKMTFEKIFRHAVDPGDIAVMLEHETVRIELVQLSPPAGDTLACFEEDARQFLFPEPKLVPSFSGVDREVLMTRAPYFPGIAPRLEFSTKTTITECSADARVNIYPNILTRPTMKRKTNRSRHFRTSSPQRSRPQTPGRTHSFRKNRDNNGAGPTSTSSCSLPPIIPKSQSLSPLRAGGSHHHHYHHHHRRRTVPADMDVSCTSQPTLDSSHSSTVLTSSSSPLIRSSSTVRFSPTERRKSSSNGLFGGISEDDSSSSETRGDRRDPEPSSRSQARHVSRSPSSSHREWEEVNERVRGLLTTPKAVRRLLYGASVSEVDTVLARRSISPGPPR